MAVRAVPRITVLMPCFNSESTVQTAVESILSQSFRDWGFLIINDGSTDGTAPLLDRLAASDTRIRVIHQANVGLTQSLIRGCCEVRSPFIARQDADDISLSDRLAKQYELLAGRPEVGFVSCFADYIGPRGEYLSTVTRPADSVEATEKLLNEQLGPPAHGTVMFRKSVYDRVGGYRSQFYYAQDSDLWLRMAEVSQIAYVQASCYQFRWHTTSITGSGSAPQSEFGRLGQRCRKARKDGHSEQAWLDQAQRLNESIVESRKLPPFELDSTAKVSSRQSMLYLIACQLVANNDPRARTYLRELLRQEPWHWKAWIRLGQSLIGSLRQAIANVILSRRS